MLSVCKMYDRLNRLSWDQALQVALRRAKLLEQLRDTKRLRLKDEMLAELLGDPAYPVAFYSNTRFRLGPVALTTTLTTNIHNPGTTTGGVGCTGAPFDKLYTILSHIRVTNKTVSAATVSLWIGATGANAAGTEFAWNGSYVPAQASGNQNWLDWYGSVRFGQADFLVGGAGTTLALTLDGEGEIGIGA